MAGNCRGARGRHGGAAADEPLRFDRFSLPKWKALPWPRRAAPVAGGRRGCRPARSRTRSTAGRAGPPASTAQGTLVDEAQPPPGATRLRIGPHGRGWSPGGRPGTLRDDGRHATEAYGQAAEAGTQRTRATRALFVSRQRPGALEHRRAGAVSRRSGLVGVSDLSTVTQAALSKGVPESPTNLRQVLRKVEASIIREALQRYGSQTRPPSTSASARRRSPARPACSTPSDEPRLSVSEQPYDHRSALSVRSWRCVSSLYPCGLQRHAAQQWVSRTPPTLSISE